MHTHPHDARHPGAVITPATAKLEKRNKDESMAKSNMIWCLTTL